MRHGLAAACMFLGAMLFILLPSQHAHAATLKFGEEAPGFTLKDLQGKKVSLADLAGSERKPGSNGVILVFFTRWCVSCSRELPVVDTLVDEFKARGITILLIGYQEEADDLAAHLKNLRVSKATALSDVSGRTGKKYKIRFFPTVYAIGADGNVKDLLFGESKDVAREFRQLADKLAPR